MRRASQMLSLVHWENLVRPNTIQIRICALSGATSAVNQEPILAQDTRPRERFRGIFQVLC